MGLLFHIVEVALLLLAAYSLGWGAGYVARRVTARPVAEPAPVIPAERLAAARGEGATAKAAVTAALSTAAPAQRPGEPWSGELDGQAAPHFEREPESESTAGGEPQTPQLSVIDAGLTDDAIVEVDAEIPPPPVEPEKAEQVPPPQPEAEPPVAELPVAVAVEAAPEVAAPVPVAEAPEPPAEEELDEDAARLAIESGWSRARARALPDEPELTDLGAAVAAAQNAVEGAIRKLENEPAEELPRRREAK